MAQLLTAAYAEDRRNPMIYPDLQTVRIYADTYTRIPVYTALDYEADDMLDLYAALRDPIHFFWKAVFWTRMAAIPSSLYPVGNAW